MNGIPTHLAVLSIGCFYFVEKSCMKLFLDNTMKEETFIGLEFSFNFISMFVSTGIGDYYSYIITREVILMQFKMQYS